MRTIGLIGGMSWHSTADYYRMIQEETAARLGGHASAPLLLHSVDFSGIRHLQLVGDWTTAGATLARAARGLEAAGADVVVLATNLMHKVAPAIEDALDVPFLHIADAVAACASAEGVRTVGLLGTGWVMEESFYADRLARHGIATLVPDAPARSAIDAAIFEELTVGIVSQRAEDLLLDAVDGLARRGADAVVLACTELQQAIGPDDTGVPLIDSTRAHALAAVDAAMAGASARAR